MKYLIPNADDFGFTRDVNEGIVHAHRQGILTATTLMATGAAFDHAVVLARENRSLDVGVHLVLVGSQGFPDTVRAIVAGHAELIKQYGSYLSAYQNEYIHLTADVRERMRLELIAFHPKIDSVFERAMDNGETGPNLIVKNARLALICVLYQLSRLGSEQHQIDLHKTAEGLSEILIYGLASGRSVA